MQTWLMGVLGMVMLVPTVQAADAPDLQSVTDPDGQTIGVVLQCSSCQSAAGASKSCHKGMEQGWLDGKPCGKCLIEANYGARFSYPHDLHFVGKLVDANGEPLKDRFVKLFMANGWNVRTKTSQEGTYRMVLGATAERKGTRPLVIELGTRVDSPKNNEAYYAFFMLPDAYKPCPATAAQPPAKAKKEAPRKK